MMKAVAIALVVLLSSTVPSYAQRPCDRVTPFQHSSPTGPVVVVAGIPGQRVYLCGYMVAQKGQTLDVQIMGGNDANCTTDRIELTPIFSLPNDFAVVNRIEHVGPALPSGYSLCLQTFGTGSLTGVVYWAQF